MDLADEISRAEGYHAFLESHFLAMLTTQRKDGLLSTTPVGYVWDGERIRISSIKSRVKCKNVLDNGKVCFCVQSPTNPMDYVEVRGIATLVDDADRSFFRQQLRRGTGGEDPPEDLDPPEAERVIIMIHPLQVSAPKVYGDRLDDWADKKKS